jgi:hypothetical protein
MPIPNKPSTTFVASTFAAWLAGLCEAGLIPRSIGAFILLALGIAIARRIAERPRPRAGSVLVYPVSYALVLTAAVAWYAATRQRLLVIELVLPTLFVVIPYAAASTRRAVVDDPT